MKYLVLGIVLWPLLVRGQDEAIEDEFALLEEALSIDEVESASKHRQSILWSPSAISVLTRKDIRASGATSLPDLLRRVPGMDVIQVKSSYTLVGARSQTDEYNNLVLLLVDGREELLELTGFAFWNVLSIDLEEIERIEVIRGPGSALYGANAFAAVVNITTVRERPQAGADLYLSGGQSGRRRLFARVRNHHRLDRGRLSYSLSLGMEDELSPSDISEKSLGSFRAHGIVCYQVPGELKLSLHGGLIGGKAMISIYMGDLDIPELVLPWLMAKAEFALGDSTRLNAQFYVSRFDGDLKARADIRAYGVWLADIPDLTWNTHSMDGQLQLETRFSKDLLFIAGANLRFSTLEGNNFILSADHELRGAGFAHLNWAIAEPLQLTGGIRLDINAITGPAPSPRVAVVYQPVPEHALRLSYGLAFRKPSFLESQVHLKVADYNPSVPEIVDLMADQLGNPDLRNEKVHTVELGFRSHLMDNRLKLSLELFVSRFQDIMYMITIVPEGSFGLPDLRNADVRFRNAGGEVTALGAEAELTASPKEHWHLWINAGIRHSRQDREEHRTVQEPLLRLNLGARYLPDSGFMADLALHGVTSYTQRFVDPANILARASQPDMGEQLLLISRLGYRLRAPGVELDAGLTVRAPLTANRREFPGARMPLWLGSELGSDFQGERFDRRVVGYLRGAF